MRALLLASLLLLAGCSGSDNATTTTPPGTTVTTGADGSTTTVSTTSTAPAVVEKSSILHLGLPPTMTPLAPNGTEAQEVAFPATFGSAGPTEDGGLSWSYAMQSTATLEGKLTFHIRVVEPLVDFSAGNEGCAWDLVLTAGSLVADGCVAAPVGPLMPGDYGIEIDLTGHAVGTQIQAGTVVELNVQRFVASLSQNDAVFFVTGTPELDGQLLLTGLAEPVA